MSEDITPLVLEIAKAIETLCSRSGSFDPILISGCFSSLAFEDSFRGDTSIKSTSTCTLVFSLTGEGQQYRCLL